MYALVEIQGKQYKAETGAVIEVDKLADNTGSEIVFPNVLLVSSDKGIKVGTPYIEKVNVKATIEDHIRGKKIIGFKYKKRKRYRRKFGHRQQFSRIRINEITGV